MATEIFNERTATEAPGAPVAATGPQASPLASNAIITITARAAEKAQGLLIEKGMKDGALRVFVVGGGCSGYQYGMSVAKAPEADDTVIEQEGVRIVVDSDSTEYLNGAEIDYTEDMMKSGFTIFNPSAVSTCACGSSFQAADGSGAARACS